MDESRHLISYLQGIKHTGPEGFEGLVALLLERLTGQRFFLAHSGSQDGRDMSTGGLDGTWIAVEAKHLKTKKSFDRSDLLGELLELPEGIDLWVLASTVRVPDQIVTALRDKAAGLGIAVDMLDAPLDRLGDLPVLCAAHEDVVLPFLTEIGAGADLGQILEAIRRHPDYTSTLEKLRNRFQAGSIGYAQARDASLSYLRSAFEDASRARVELGQPINVMENEGRHVVARSQVLEALDAWWRDWPSASKPFVLLGEEGLGKTWAIASWLARRLAIPDSLPLTLFLPSRAVSAFKALDLMAEALATCSGVPDSKLWSRRAKSFAERSSERRPALLLVLDGLNERPTFDWRTLLESLQISPWKDQVAMVLTCRPAFWREELSPALQISFQISEVGPYDDAELESALEKGGLQATDLSTTLEPLLRRPRYLDLTVRHRRALEQSGDVTVDRLLYEDWKDRVSRKRGLFSDEDFRALLVQLAESHRDRLLSKREVQDLLPSGDAFLTGLDEIITGGILVRAPLGRYSVEPRRLVQGLGLLLADQVRNVSDQGEAVMKETMASFLEPHADMDRKVAICRFAATFAVLEPDFPEAARAVLLEQWIGGRNLSFEDVECFTAYLPASIGSYVRLVERFWTLRRTNRQAQSLLVPAFFRWRDNTRVQQALVGACEKWLSYVHPYGYRFMRGKDDAGRAELRREIEERAGCPLRPGRNFLLVDELECIEDDHSLRLAEPALLLASLFPVASFIPALRRWALSRSVMGYPEEIETVAWVLRGSGEDLWPSLETAVAPLLNGPRVEQQAAWRLLWASGREEAASVLEQLSEDLFPPSDYEETYAEDPCRPFWRQEDCAMCAARVDLPDRLVALKLASHARNPDLQIGFDLRPRLRRALSDIQTEQISSGPETTVADNEVRRMEPTIAAFAPDLLADLYRNLVRQLPERSKKGRQVLLSELDSLTLVLSRKEWRALKTLWDQACRTEPWNDEARYEESLLFAAVLFHVSAKTQIDLFLSRPERTFDHPKFGSFFKTLPANQIRPLARDLLESTPRNLRRKLLNLRYQSAIPVVKILGAEQLVGLLDHSDPETRDIAADWVFWSDSHEVFDLAVERGKITPSWTRSIRRSWGDQLGIISRSRLPYETLAQAIDLGTLSFLVRKRRSDLASYTRDLDQAVQSVVSTGDEAFRAGFCEETLQMIAKRTPRVVEGWFRLAVAQQEGRSVLIRRCRMVLEPLCEVLLEIDPEKGAELFQALVDQRKRGMTVDAALELDVLALTLFRVPQSDHTDSLLSGWYDDCTTDKALFELALAASAVRNDERLSALIQQSLSSPVPVKKAAALALAGFAIHGMGAATLLESVEVHPDGWLHEIRKWARQHLERDRWGQEWFRRFVESPSTEESFAAFRLFLRCVDRRYWIWGNDILKRTRLRSDRRIYLAVNRDRIEKAIEENEKGFEKRFIGSEVPEDKVYPWLDRYLG